MTNDRMTDDRMTNNRMGSDGMGIVRLVAAVSGVVFLLVGAIGFIPAISPPADSVQGMEVADAAVLGLVPVNVVANIVHLLFGAILLYGATTTSLAITVLRGLGIVYLLLALIGLFADEGFGILPLGGGELVVHIATALVFLGVGFFLSDRSGDARAAV